MIIGITRAERFSPNSTDKDRAIMQAVIGLLRGKMIAEEDFCGLPPDTCCTILSMARLPRTLQLLKQCEASGTTVINPARGVENCRRSVLDGIMRSAAIPMPPTTGKDGYWIKRGDAAAQSPSDVVFCENEAELELAEKRFTDSGITNYVVSAHVCGDLVKFYGVEGTGFSECTTLPKTASASSATRSATVLHIITIMTPVVCNPKRNGYPHSSARRYTEATQ